MKILCKVCGKTFESVIVDRDLAFREVEEMSTQHVRLHHKELFAAVAKGVQKCSFALARILHFDNCAVIPDDESYAIGKIEGTEELVMLALGYDPDVEEEEEEEEDDDNEEEIELDPTIPTEGTIIDSTPIDKP